VFNNKKESPIITEQKEKTNQIGKESLSIFFSRFQVRAIETANGEDKIVSAFMLRSWNVFAW
jgi:hypothetical protein